MPFVLPPVVRLVTAGLVLVSLAACATAPALDMTPPPRKPYDAKTQLEYGDPPPAPAPKY